MPRRSPANFAAPDPLSALFSEISTMTGPVTTIKAVTDLPARLYGGNAQTVEVSASITRCISITRNLPDARADAAIGKWTVVWDRTC